MKSSEIVLYDIAGSKVMQTVVKRNGTLSVSRLPQGVYLYRIHTGSRNYSGLLIIRH